MRTATQGRGTRPLRMAFWGHFGTGNLGNECTLQAIVHNARRYVPRAELTCICSEPADTMRRHGIQAVPINPLRGRGAGRQDSRRPRLLRRTLRLFAELGSWSRAFRMMWRIDALVMSGTGMLADAGEGPSGLPYEIFKWSLVAKLCRSRLLFVSVGVEPIRHPLARLFVRVALRLADYRSYRDVQSRALLRQIGFTAADDAVYPDLAFSLPESLADGLDCSVRERPTIAVGLYDYCSRGEAGAGQATAYHGYLEKVRSLVLWLLEHDYSVRVVIGDLSYDEAVRHDLKACLEAGANSLARGRFSDEPARSVHDLLAQLAGVDLVVATRFHHVLLSLVLGKPVVSVSYNEKNDALMAQMGLEEYCQSVNRFEVDRVIRQLVGLEHNWARLREGIRARARQNRAELERQYALVFRSV